jgi:hypothetical protein
MPLAKQVAEKDGLELDRVLAAMGQLGREAVLSGPRGHGVDQIAVDGGCAQRGRVVLARQREGIRHPGVARAEDHKAVGVAALGEVAIGPGIGGTTAVVVDVRGDDTAHRRPAGATLPPDRSRAGRRGKETLHGAAKVVRVARIGASGVRGRALGSGQELGVDGPAPLRETLILEKAMGVEGAHDLLDLLPADHLTVAAHDLRLDVDDGVFAVEERHDGQERPGEHEHRRCVPGRITHADELLTVLLDGKSLDVAAKTRALDHTLSRKFRAEPM